KADESPIRDAGNDVQPEEQCDLEDAPIRECVTFPLNRAVDRFRIVTKVRAENVCPRILGLPIMPVLVDRERITRAAVSVGKIGIPFVVILVDLLVEDLREADGDRFEHAEAAIENVTLEVGIVQEVVRDTVDVPGNADRPDESKGNEHPPLQAGEGEK